jgi:hypothetical protein
MLLYEVFRCEIEVSANGNIGQKNQMSLKRVSRFKTSVPWITQSNS